MHDIIPNNTTAPADLAACRICTIKLLQLGYRRAWWLRPLREMFARGIRIFALFHPVPSEAYAVRSPLCQGCLRFRKNAVRQGSPLFRRLDARLNPVFNRIRDSLVTPQEIENAREFARRAADPAFSGWWHADVAGMHLSVDVDPPTSRTDRTAVRLSATGRQGHAPVTQPGRRTIRWTRPTGNCSRRASR